MLQHVEGEDSVKTVLAGVFAQRVLAMEEVNSEALPGGALAREAHGDTVHVVISNPMAAASQLQQDFPVAGAIVERGALRQAQDLHVGAYALVLKVVSGDGK